MNPDLAPADHGDAAGEIAAIRTAAGRAERPWQAVLTLIGPDARRFANGMFTNNVRDLPIGRANAHAMVDERARIQGLLDLWCIGQDSFLIVLDGVSAEAFVARYEKFIIFDDVELTDVSEEFAVATIQGPLAPEVLTRAGLPTPATEGDHAELNGIRVHRRARSVAGGFDLVVPGDQFDAVWARIDVPDLGWTAQELARIEAGHARWPVDMGEKSLVHEMRLVGRVSNFTKGCYIGQEVINRIDVMGQVTKKLWALELPSIPAPNTPVTLAGEVVGHTLSGAMDGPRARVMALLRKAAWVDGGTVEVEGIGTATVHDLPTG